LLAECRAGDADAFDQFYIRYREAMVAFFARRVREPEVAADLTAETFATALTIVLSSRPLPDMPAAWLFTVARNLLVDSSRRGRVEADARRQLGIGLLSLDDADIERIAEIEAATDLLEKARATLSSSEWDAVHARIVDETPYPELAQRLRCSEAVARKRVSRAVAHLRTAIGGSRV
jgi:RNA polymerase sigma-70 factor (ECF subfamily)